jgi:hypothetical protein
MNRNELPSSLTPIDPKAALAELDATVKRYTEQLAIYNAALEVMQSFEGKQITKRIATALEKKLPGKVIHYSTEYSWYAISIWGDGVAYDNAIRLNLGYLSAGNTLDLAKVKEHNLCYGLHSERLVNIAAIRDSVPARLAKINKAIEAYNAAVAESQDLGEGHSASTVNLLYMA